MALCTVLSISWILTGCTSINRDLKTVDTGSEQYIMTALKNTINAKMKGKNITGLSISVSDSKGLLWSEGFGLSNKKNSIPFTDETVSNIGSVSKLITATAIMRLVDKKIIDLDKPVSTYIPEFNPKVYNLSEKPITVRMLLNHESGLESDAFFEFFLDNETPKDYRYTYRRAIEAVNKSGIVRDPYEIFSYCNLGYSLLGIIVERAQGGNFQEAVENLIFNPLSMNNSTFILDDVPKEELSIGYKAGKSVNIPYIRDMPAGSLNSSAKDMGNFLQNMLISYNSEEGLLHRETVKEMFTPSNERVINDLDFKIGIAWWIVDLKILPDEFIVGHGGDLPPFHAMVMVLPDRDLSLFIMVNSVDGVGSFSLTDIISKTIRSFVRIKGQNPIPKALGKSPIIDMPASIKESLPGYYASSAGLSEIKLLNNKLKIFTFNKWFDLYYHSDNTLTLGMKLFGIIPLKLPVFEDLSISLENINNTPAINLRVQDILISPSLRIEPPPINPAWFERSGQYESIKTESNPLYTDFKIELDKKRGFLCFSLKSNGEWSKFPLQTIDSTNAQLMGIGRGLGGIVRVNTSDTGETLSFLNFDLRKK